MTDNTYQQEEIELFLLKIAESPLYTSKEYLIHTIRKPFLDFLSSLRLNNFDPPPFLLDIHRFIGDSFDESGITPINMLNYMLNNDMYDWVHYTTFSLCGIGGCFFAPCRELSALLSQSVTGGFAAELVVAVPQLTP